MEEKTKKVTALEMWNTLLAKLLVEPFLNTATTKALSNRQYLAIFTKRIDMAIGVAEYFEITKFRIIIDALIEQRKETDERMARLSEQYMKTWWIQWGKRKRILLAIDSITLEQSIWERALRTVINTVPPGNIDWLKTLAIKAGRLKGNLPKEDNILSMLPEEKTK